MNFGAHPEYYEYEPDPQHPGQYRPRPWMFGGASDGVGVFFANPLVTCPNAQAYQDAMVKWVDYVMKQGADGVFVDVMVKRSHCDGPAAASTRTSFPKWPTIRTRRRTTPSRCSSGACAERSNAIVPMASCSATPEIR